MMPYATLQSLVLIFTQLLSVLHPLLHRSNSPFTRNNLRTHNLSKLTCSQATQAPLTRYLNLRTPGVSILAISSQ